MDLTMHRRLAISAVSLCSQVARRVQATLVPSQGLTKSDNSPVTVADYACQLLVSRLLFTHLPNIPMIGEESSADIDPSMLRQVKELVNEALRGEKEEAGLWPKGEMDEESCKQLLDKAGGEGVGRSGLQWALDPIDGTKGFLRRGQYAICLALIRDGKPIMGVMGCPNLPVLPTSPDGEKGVIFTATRGEGAHQRSLTNAELRPIKMNPIQSIDLSNATFCESVESGHSDQGTNSRIASILGITRPSVRMDSQAKYCSISRGDGDIYLRLPTSKTYEEKIWDHASGVVLVEEAGGRVSDMFGKELDFGVGRTLKNNKGVIAAHRDVHAKVLEAVKEATASSSL
ncbi:3',5'-bisphosphate nucleotidase [Atractiella rhizophila]|nr:3',5'-bisphosphate nucleotidase [Atractiella rhizophila]